MPDGFNASTFAKAQDEASLLLDVRLQPASIHQTHTFISNGYNLNNSLP